MRTEIIHSKGSVSKKVVYEQNDNQNLSWMRDIRLVECDGSFMEVEPACVPLVGLGRSILFHLRTCGVLDGYEIDKQDLDGQPVSYVCKLELYLEDGDRNYVIRLDLSYRLRNSSVTSVSGLNQEDMVNFLYDRIVRGGHHLASVEMRMKYLLVLHKVLCSINGLQVPL